MKDYHTDERRLHDYYLNCFMQFKRIGEATIPRFWEILRYKTEVKTFDLNSSAKKKLFLFFLLISLDMGEKVPASVKRFLDVEEKKIFSIGPTSLSIKEEKEAESLILDFFVSKEVKDEMKKVVDDLWDGHISVDEEELESLKKLYENLCIFGNNVAWMLK